MHRMREFALGNATIVGPVWVLYFDVHIDVHVSSVHHTP